MMPARQPALRKMIAVVWTLLILTACWLPLPAMPEETIDLGIRIPDFDKLVHTALFCGFGGLWMLAGAQSRGRTLMVAISGVALAVISEAGQATSLVNRDASLMDALADLTGLVLGVGVALRVVGRSEKMIASEPVTAENRT